VVVLEAEKPQALVQPEDPEEVHPPMVRAQHGLEIAVEMVVHHQFLKDMRVVTELMLYLAITEAEAAEAEHTKSVVMLIFLHQLSAVPEEMVYQIQ
jgi:hypothetical protein